MQRVHMPISRYHGRVSLQLALLMLPKKINLYNITAKCEEPESLAVATSGKQWLVTPNGAALLAVYSSSPTDSASTNPVWVFDSFALEQCPPEQNMFDQIATGVPLPHELAHLSAEVRAVSYQTEFANNVFSTCSVFLAHFYNLPILSLACRRAIVNTCILCMSTAHPFERKFGFVGNVHSVVCKLPYTTWHALRGRALVLLHPFCRG
jgi:hypothetical protein